MNVNTDVFEIPFTQYVRPDGRTRSIGWRCSSDEEEKAKVLLDRGCKFEAEVLVTGDVSFTVECDAVDEDAPIAVEVVPNDKSVTSAVERLTDTAYAVVIK